MEELLKEIKEHYIEQPNVKRGKFYIEALTLEKIIKDWLTNNKRLQLEVMPKIAEEAFEEIPEPIGNIVLKFGYTHQPILANDGTYYHYADICNMLSNIKKLSNLSN